MVESYHFLKETIEKNLPMNLEVEWSNENAVLFVPYQSEQALLYEYADCVASRAFFKMASLPFRLEQRPNAEFMSPTGKVPFLKLQDVLVAEFGGIVEFAGKKGIKLAGTLTEIEKSDLHAFMALIEEDLKNAEIFMSWVHGATYTMVTKPRYSSVYLFPLNIWLPRLKRTQMIKYLKKIGWENRTHDEVLGDCDRVFRALATKLGNHKYFIGDQPTELDALAFGHLYTLLTTELPNMQIAESLKRHPNLIDFCKRIDQEFFAV